MLDRRSMAEFQQKQAELDRDWRERESRANARRHWIEIVIVGIGASLVSAIAQLMAVWIQAKSDPVPTPQPAPQSVAPAAVQPKQLNP